MLLVRRPVLAASILVLALNSGCEGKAKEGAGGEGRSSGADAVQGYDPEARARVGYPLHASTLALDEAGSEPREVLRHGVYGSSRRLKLVSSSFHDDELTPLVELVMSWAGAATRSETLGYQWAVLDATHGMRGPEGSADQFADRLEEMFERLRGQASGTSVGLVRVIQTEGAQATPNPVVLLFMFAVPLPEEAVGVGASWTRTTRFDERLGPSKEGPKLRALLLGSRPESALDGSKQTQVERYTLVEREGPLLTIAYEMRLGVEGDSQSQTALGRVFVSLGDPLAQAGSLDLVTTTVFPAGEGEEPMTHDSRQRVTLEAL